MITLGSVTPILRIFDEAKAREFYVDFLGFEIVFEHRFGENFPLYMGLRLGDCVLHLSGHHGDGSPGITIRIAAGGVEQLARDLAAKDYRFAKPGAPVRQPWGTLELVLTDPFGNRLIFAEAQA
jgi:uncharacterized glyoxalase superfamily protein PhnB